MEMHFASIWEQISDLIPDEPVLICENNIKNWREFDDRSARLANFLSSKSLKADSKVGLYLHNSRKNIVCLLNMVIAFIVNFLLHITLESYYRKSHPHSNHPPRTLFP